MDAPRQNEEMEKELLQETFKFVNCCLIRSGIRPPIIGSDGKANAKLVPPPEPSEKYKALLEWAESNTVQLVRERAQQVLIDPDAPVENVGKGLEQYRKLLNRINRDVAENKMPAVKDAIRLRLKVCKKLNDKLALEKNLKILELMQDSECPKFDQLVWDRTANKAGIGSADIVQPEVKLTYPAHNRMPQYAECISVDKANLVAERNLRPGDVIALEETHCWFVDPTSRFERCDWCLKYDPLCLLACNGCQLVMYCSLQCRKEAQVAYHAMECKVVQAFPRKEPEQCMLPTLRSVCMAFGVFGYAFGSLRECFEHAREETFVPLHQRDWVNMNSQQMFCAKMGESMGWTKRNRNRNLPLTISVYQLFCAIVKYFDDQSLSGEDERFLREFIEWHLKQSRQLLLLNEVMVYKEFEGMLTEENKTVSYGWYTLLKQFPPCSNEPICTPNVELIDVAPKTKAAIVLRPVAKGQPLTIRRIDDHECRCIACEYEYTGLLEADDHPGAREKLQQRIHQMEKWEGVKPPYSSEFFYDQVQLLRCLRSYYMESQGP
uniref:MYND-type domain-containing protein n=1 Tax=Anopheles atroparvus TaxID=41427 RepID=A0A182IQS7_ANOAO